MQIYTFGFLSFLTFFGVDPLELPPGPLLEPLPPRLASVGLPSAGEIDAVSS